MNSPLRYALVLSVMVTGCQEAPTSLALGRAALPNGASHSSSSFSVYDNSDFVLSCMNGESTHWEGWIYGTVDITTTPSGLTHEYVKLEFDKDFFVERENGTRYYSTSNFRVSENRHFGERTVITGTASGPWRSANGDILVLGFHVQLVYNKDGNPVIEKFTGACP